MIVCAALAPDREQFAFQFSVFEQALFLTNYTCREYGDFLYFIKQISLGWRALTDPKNRGSIIAVLLLVCAIFIATITKFL